MRKKVFRFKRQSVKRKQIEDRWRKPPGKQSKLRLGRRGKGPRVKIGYKRGEAGPEPFRVFRPEDLEKLKEAKPEGKVLIAAGVGRKKREAIIKRAKELKIELRNAR
jgi:large subunit ribosomal protein L32e